MFITSKESKRKQRISQLKNRTKNNRYIAGNVVPKTTDNKTRRLKVVDKEKVIVENFSAPIWLKTLFVLEKSTSVACFLVVGSMLTLYGMTVYAPQLWTQQFNKLKQLQKNERQMTSTNEVVKEDLVKQADKSDTGLVNPDPQKPPIFLKETTVNSVAINKKQKESVIEPPEVLLPIAY